jgi:hypothetical protein
MDEPLLRLTLLVRVLVLISLTLVVFANVIGAAIAGVRAVLGTKRRRP